MDERNNNNALKIAIGILAICLLGLGFYTIQSYHETKSDLDVLEQEKSQLKTTLENLAAKYDEAVATNQSLLKDVSEAKRRIARLLDSVEKMEVTYVHLLKYKMQIGSLKKEKEALFRVIDSLESKNTLLQKQVDSTETQLVESQKRIDSLAQQNEKLSGKVIEASRLKITNLQPKMLVLKSNGEHKTTTNLSRTEAIEVCFTLDKNNLASAGNKRFYIQIIDPRHNLLGKGAAIEFGEAVLNYSKTVNVMYKNTTEEVCTPIPINGQPLQKGLYLVNIFLGAEQLASTTMQLE